MSDTDTETTQTNEAVVTRVFDAPRELVWRMLTEPEHFAAWFGTPPYTTAPETVQMDVRPGGRWQATMRHESDGSEQPFHGAFREIDAPSRLVQTFDDPANAENPDIEVLTSALVDLGDGKTELTYHQVGHLPPEQYPLIEQGVAGFYARMAEHLATC